MNSIKILPSNIINKIAAGEVIERPASILRELLDNSIDAGSTHIEIVVDEAGVKKLSIKDNGIGIDEKEIKLAVLRHATSKIETEDDLFSINTLGFRGEALPSIASISKFTISSKREEQDLGSKISIEGGDIVEESPIMMNRGTHIIVEDLFYNVPVRRKFLKKEHTEFSYLYDLFNRYAIFYHNIYFDFYKNGKKILSLPQQTQIERIREVFGLEIADSLFEITDNSVDFNITGFIGKPELSYKTNNNIYIFLNGRYIKDKTILVAISRAYSTLMEHGKYPFVTLFCKVNPTFMDVNVHPQKAEVRFNDTNRVFSFVYHTITDTLSKTPWVKKEIVGDITKNIDSINSYNQRFLDFSNKNELSNIFEQNREIPSLEGALKKSDKSEHFPPQNKSEIDEKNSSQQFTQKHYNYYFPEQLNKNNNFNDSKTSNLKNRDGESPFLRDIIKESLFIKDPNFSNQNISNNSYNPTALFSNLIVIGQIFSTYIVCQSSDSLILIDQHAAHERIGYEELLKNYHGKKKQSEELLIPILIELNYDKIAIFEEYNSVFEEMGFVITVFGDKTLKVERVPSIFINSKITKLILEIIEELQTTGFTSRYEERLREIFSRIACHSVVRGGDLMNNYEIYSLLNKMDEIDFSAHCPHGRPVYFKIHISEIEKKFHR
ncbi:DNA mismatch repair endonuclease MutL [bacterium]|nr:DNA mismatch repair endonuclease MutL [bacterium]